MSELVGLSFDAPASPEISFERSRGSSHASSGWGLAWFPAGELSAAVVRDPYSGESAGLAQVLHDWDRFRTALVVAHLRGASKRATHRDTHPFVRLWGGRSWVLAHDGDLGGDLPAKLPLPLGPQFVPGGTTDTEHLFSWLLAEAAAAGVGRLSDLGYERLHDMLEGANDLGSLTLLLADGEDLVAYRDARGAGEIWWTRRVPPHPDSALRSAGISVELDQRQDTNRVAFVTSSVPLSDTGWEEVPPGQMIVVRRGSMVHASFTHGALESDMPQLNQPSENGGQAASAPTRVRTRPETRTLEIFHRTTYTYDAPVERSSHRLRLSPVEDGYQRVIERQVDVNSDGTRFRFEDVFGNDVTGLEVTAPFDRLDISSRAVVEVRAPDDRPHLVPDRPTLPLVWMPWQQEMMTPYLLPPELPESQLRELAEYAMGFVARNRQDALATLDDITGTIYRDFDYKPGFTTLETTPFEVYSTRSGVCQDFANLMICACRLLNVPARYRVGYIYTGADYANTLQSDASHAWVEVFLPYVGWRGYDPTNGCRVGSDHVRVAAGRNYRDATPTAGVIHRGGGGEQLTIDVRVEEHRHEGPAGG